MSSPWTKLAAKAIANALQLKPFPWRWHASTLYLICFSGISSRVGNRWHVAISSSCRPCCRTPTSGSVQKPLWRPRARGRGRRGQLGRFFLQLPLESWYVGSTYNNYPSRPNGLPVAFRPLWKLYLEDECGVVHKSRTQFVVGGERINFVKKEQQPVDFLMENDLCLKLK